MCGIFLVTKGEEWEEDALDVDEEGSAIGTIGGSHEGTVGLVQIQMTCCIDVLYRKKGNCIGSVWQYR